MSTLTIILIILTGFAAGVLGSMVGIGGGIVVVPALIAMAALIPGMNPRMATGTSLAMLLPPIGILGVYQYYKHGQVNLYVAGLLCAGFYSEAGSAAVSPCPSTRTPSKRCSRYSCCSSV